MGCLYERPGPRQIQIVIDQGQDAVEEADGVWRVRMHLERFLIFPAGVDEEHAGVADTAMVFDEHATFLVANVIGGVSHGLGHRLLVSLAGVETDEGMQFHNSHSFDRGIHPDIYRHTADTMLSAAMG
jgi:hypothetical protein